MIIKKILIIFLVVQTLFFISCGYDEEKKISISGSITAENIDTEIDAPILIAVATGDDIDIIKNNPEEAIIKFAGINESERTYNLDLSDTDLKVGDKIFIVAFADNNFSGGIPLPDEGDYIGFYMDSEKLSSSHIIKEGENKELDIDISREVFKFDAEISGTISGVDPGEITLIAYAGEIVSSDLTQLDPNGIIGYQKITKVSGAVDYKIDILPYGYNVPVEKVFLFAVVDINGNGEIDVGDKAGYYKKSDSDLPSPITVNEGENPDIDISEFTIDIPETTGLNISLRGTFTIPYQYDEDSPPVYIILADIDNVEDVFDNPSDAIKYFYKMPAGEFYFDIDLSNTDIKPGDTMMLIALWDKDFEGGFPNPTKGDKIGFIQNNDSYAFTIEMELGENRVPREGYEFNINKIIYDFESSLMFALDKGEIDSWIVDRSQLIIMTIHAGGVNYSMNSSGNPDVEIDMDYVLGIKIIKPPVFDNNPDGSIPDLQFENEMREIDLFPAVYHEIIIYEDSTPPDPLYQGVENQSSGDIETAYLIAVLDVNGNGEMDGDDMIGYYSEPYEVEEGQQLDIPGVGMVDVPAGTYYLPVPIETISKNRNKILVDDNGTPDEKSDDTYDPFWVKFDYYDEPAE